ncbi:hypothetical protein SAMN05421812_10949 [Asanoa hainanensis]|uniref:Uncharacterized protein n=1 Tax=Asanoa hainanensis TaxID=560556 RepID=A0A239NIT4_9ACTN|nr:hypothetical protein [Asanoa hainanensis]SNT54373.1 hypothetical protein SAMN05421812_10949 [Asanoa hainanensis]
MARREIDEKMLTRMRNRRAWWWAVWATPVTYLGWLGVLMGAALLLALPGARLAQVVLGIVGLAVGAAVVKAMAVELVIRRTLDRSTRFSMRALDRDVNRRQIYRKTRWDAVVCSGALLWALFGL